jgi:lysozyme family protein
MANQTRGELIQAKNILRRRRASTADPAEQAAIDAALAELDEAIDAITQASLLQAAGIVASATDALERVVASARLGPFDTFLSDIQQSIGQLQGELETMQASERLMPAPVPASPATATEAAPPPLAASAPAAVPASGTVRPINSRRFEDLRDEYGQFFDRCRLRPEFAANAEFYVSRLAKFKPTYKQLGDELGIPWVFIGIVHGMECGFNFGTHLHNGDPLSARTVHVPKGRPTSGAPPFTWTESARDALVFEKLDQVDDWSLPHLLYLLEAYNGFGYRPHFVPTPYLWSFSNLYSAGKFVGDGVFDANAVSKQCGAAVMLRVLQERGLV